MMRANIWPRSPGATLPGHCRRYRENPVIFFWILGGHNWEAIDKTLKKYLADLLRGLKHAKAEYANPQ
jgi:hypothetical protein